jgi:hypothetical protein
MHQVKCIARIQYQEFDGTNNVKDYYFFARDKENARAIANELFKVSNPKARNVQVGIKFEKPTQEEIDNINQQIENIFTPFKRDVESKKYKDFLQMFLDFEGWDFKKNYDNAEFMCQFQGFTCKVICRSDMCSVDEEEIIYHSFSNNRDYVIKDDGITLLIGS